METLLRTYGADPIETRIARKVDTVRGLVAAYAADRGNDEREIDRVEDLYDDTTGLPR